MKYDEETTKLLILNNNHNYIRLNQIRKDMKILDKKSIIKNCKDYQYLKVYFIEITVKNNLISTKLRLFEQFIINNYKDIQINYKDINEEKK